MNEERIAFIIAPLTIYMVGAIYMVSLNYNTSYFIGGILAHLGAIMMTYKNGSIHAGEKE